MTKAIVIAGTASGVGKTTIATGLIAALVKQGLSVQPFKAGPDYIDPGYHSRAAGQVCRNLDSWMLPPGAVIELFDRAASGHDIAVVEGVMGLYDGREAMGDAGSTAELAKLLGAPVVLIVDSRKGARSTAAVVSGFRDFDPGLLFGGVILNGIGTQGHLKVCREAIEHYTGVPVLGYLPRRDDLVLPERHLGLVPSGENPVGSDFLKRLEQQCCDSLDIPRILEIAACCSHSRLTSYLFPPKPLEKCTKLALARDRAFDFYYQDNLDLLEAWGAELLPFSPLSDTGLPSGINGIYLGGGFPELYALELADNRSMKQDIKAVVADGMPAYAECGGLMYLGRSIRDFKGKRYAMAGVLDIDSQIASPRLNLGYRTVRALNNCPVLREGETVRGHEFHWSTIERSAEEANAYAVIEKGGEREGFSRGNLLASYVHLHFGASASLAPSFVKSCCNYDR